MDQRGKIGLGSQRPQAVPPQRDQSEAVLAADYKFSPVAQVTLDRKGCIRRANVAAAVLLNGELSRLTKIPFLAFVDKAYCRTFLDHLAQATSGPKKICTRLALSSATRAIGPVELQSTSRIDTISGSVFCRTALVTFSSPRHIATNERGSDQYACEEWLELFPHAAAIISVETGRFIETNKVFCRLVARLRKEIIGQPLSTIQLLGTNGKLIDFFSSALEHGSDECEAQFTRPDGSVHEMLVSAKTILSGHENCLLLMIQDPTDLRRLTKDIVAISEEEQRRFSRDLHDSHCQDLTAIAFFGETIAAGLGERDDETAGQIRMLVDMVQKSAENVHALAAGLDSQQIQEIGLIAALDDLAVRISRRFGLACTARLDQTLGELNSSQSINLFRIAQEAVSNAARHSEARTIILRLRRDGSSARLEVEDDGVGFATESHVKGLGLRTMQYRASLIKGTLTVDSRPSAGTTITCSFPVAENRYG